MALPNQLIPEEEKTQEWAEACINAIERGYNDQGDRKERIEICRHSYNGTIHQDDFKYLHTREGGKDKFGRPKQFKMPAKVRYIPICRPMFNMLESTQNSRPTVLKAYKSDGESIQNKEDMIFKDWIKMLDDQFQQKIMAMNQQAQLVEQQQQMMAQQAQAQAQGQEVPPEMMQQIQAMNEQLEFVKGVIAREIGITQEEFEKIKKYYKYTYKELDEQNAEKLCMHALKTKKAEHVFKQGFKEKIITDEEIYFVDWEPGMKHVILRKVHPENITYSIDEEVHYIDECAWVCEVQEMSLPQIVDEFPELTEDQIKVIQTYSGGSYYQHGRAISNLEGSDANGDPINETSFSNHYTGSNYNIRVTRAYWKSPTRIWVKKSPNKHTGGSFTHFVNDKEASKVRKKKKGQSKVTPVYRTDLWGGVKIGDAVYVRVGKRPIQLRKSDHMSDVPLPYIGFCRNRYNEPHSLVWQTKDLQDLYNIIHYHIELWIALAGVKGVIFDRSQKPSGISTAEWMMQVKQGIMEIETVKSGDKRRQSNFNQHGATYDHTVTPAIQYLMGINEQIRALAGEVIGVSRARMGQVQQYDQVKTTQMSYAQSSTATEFIHLEHEEVKSRTLSRYVNLGKHAYKTGFKGAYILGDMGQQILNITKDNPLKGDFEVHIDSGGKHLNAIRNLQQMAMDGYKTGKFNIAQLTKLYDMDSIQEMEKTLEYWEEKAVQRAEMSQQQQMEQQAQLQQQQKEMDMQLEQMKMQQESGLKQMELELKQQELALKAQEIQIKSEIDKAKMESDYAAKMADIQTEAAVEMEYLKQKDNIEKINARLKQIELMIESMNSNKKLDIDAANITTRSKEKIKDDSKSRK